MPSRNERSALRQFHFDPETYLEEIRADVPLFDELQQRALAAIPFAPGRVLELGIGTGETTRRLLERYPDAEITGLDSSPRWCSRRASSGSRCGLPGWRIRCRMGPGTW